MYAYRNLPCNILPDPLLWCVTGEDREHAAGGILEWCRSELDACAVLARMKKDVGRFKSLKARRYLERKVAP